MDKSQFDILSEIKQTLDSLKAQIADIEAKLADIENVSEDSRISEQESGQMEQVAADEVFIDPIDISIDIDPFEPVPDIPAYDAMSVQVSDDALPASAGHSEMPADEEAAPAAEPEPAFEAAQAVEPEEVAAEPEEPAQAPVPEAVNETAKEPDPAPAPAGTMFVEDDMPEELLAPVESINDRQEKKSRKTVMDVMGAKCAWKTAIPGTPVKNVISAISLNDRVLFINTLFKEDPMAFQDAITAFNSMESFAEAEAYVQEHHSDWNLNSDLVYRLMMAVRRKLK